ncbi:MAG: DUF1499 domain-containing protein [Pyrinomonadaceae bacterium]
MKKLLIVIGIIVAVLVAVWAVTRTFYPDNIAETALDGGNKDLKTRFYKTDLAEAAKRVKEIIPTISTWGANWKLAEDRIEGDSAVIRAEVPVVVFTDDLEVRIKQEKDQVRVDVRSASRVGKSDFGENRRHVVQILDAMDQKLGG